MGHIAHLRKQFKSINTYDYIIMLIKRRKKKHYLLYENKWVLHLKKLESPSPLDALCQDCLKLAQWFWRRGFFKILSMYFCYFVINPPRKRVGPFIWRNLNPLHPRMLYTTFGWNWLSGSGEEDFLKFHHLYFPYFVIISPRKRVGSFIWRNLNSFHSRMLCAKFGWNWLSGSGEEDFF